MKHFARLFTLLDRTTKTNEKVAALAVYFREVDDKDKLWTIALLSDRRPRRTVNTTLLRQWAAQFAEIPLWLFEESYHVVGDLGETISLVLPEPDLRHDQSLAYWIGYVRLLGEVDETERRRRVIDAWRGMDKTERFLFNKLITGSFRFGVSQKLTTKALSQATGVEENKLTHRLMGNWSPEETTFGELIWEKDLSEDLSKPYPFYLAYALESGLDELGDPADWMAERKWDGIRGQLIVRQGQLFVWSRGEELVTDKFPEYQLLAGRVPDGTVLDGEIMPWRDGRALSFQALQTRIGRKNVTASVMRQAPVVMIVYDLLEWEGQDIRHYPLRERRLMLERLLQGHPAGDVLLLSETIPFTQWEDLRTEREQSRRYRSEGLMLKRLDSPYKSGRRKGDWWKWKVDPLTIDAVLIYAQRGAGRRSNLYTDFTFAVWDGEELVPFTKAYSGLTDAEFGEITNWVRRHTVERFGPVRSVEPTYVFEIAFEGIQASGRHKSGVALRFPRMARWRKDKPVQEANTLQDLHQLLRAYQEGEP